MIFSMNTSFQSNQSKKKTKSGQRCSVPGCKSGAMENIIYHTFPKDPDLQLKWLKACGRYPPPTVGTNSEFENVKETTIKTKRILETNLIQ